MAQEKVLINGKGYSFCQIKLLIGGAPFMGVKSIEYDDKEDIEDIYGLGKYPVERGEGPITCSGKITLLMSEVLALQAKSSTGRLQDLGVFDVVVSWIPAGGKAVTDTLKACQFKDNSRKTKQGDKATEVDLELAVGMIIWNKG